MESIVEKVLEEKDYDQILPNLLSSHLVGLHLYENKNKIKPVINKFSLVFSFKEGRTMNIFVGNEIAKRAEELNVNLTLIYSENLMKTLIENDENIPLEDIKEPLNKHYYANGIKKFNDKNITVFDVLENIFIIFESAEDYEKLFGRPYTDDQQHTR